MWEIYSQGLLFRLSNRSNLDRGASSYEGIVCVCLPGVPSLDNDHTTTASRQNLLTQHLHSSPPRSSLNHD